MSRRACLTVTVIALCYPAAFADDKADRLRKEIAELKAALAAKESELAKIEAAGVLKPKPSDFADNTERYKGEKVMLAVTWDTFSRETLRELRGNELVFRVQDPANDAVFKVAALVPKDLAVPNARSDDRLVITFTCSKGRLADGNTVIAIKRP